MNDSQRVRRPAGARQRSDAGDGNGDERPRKKKNTVQMHPVVGILVLFVLPLVFVAIFAWAWMSGDKARTEVNTKPAVVDDNAQFKEIKTEKMKKAEGLYRIARKNKMNPDYPPEQLAIEQQTAMDYIAMVKLELDALLDPARNEEGDLPPEYSGYQEQLKQLNTWRYDILKEKGF